MFDYFCRVCVNCLLILCLDVEPGTVVVTNKSFNAFLKETHDIVSS